MPIKYIVKCISPVEANHRIAFVSLVNATNNVFECTLTEEMGKESNLHLISIHPNTQSEQSPPTYVHSKKRLADIGRGDIIIATEVGGITQLKDIEKNDLG